MSGNVEEAAEHECVIWRAKPTGRAVVGELLVAVLISAAFLVLRVLVPRADPWMGWPAVIPPVLSAARSIVTSVRGRVVLTRDGIEVRRVLTRHYPWASLLSLTIEDDGRIEITPKGWVRKLPIPQDEVPDAFAVITRWREAARARK